MMAAVSRRNFLKAGTSVVALPFLGCVTKRHRSRPLRVALLGTIMRKYSHAQHFVDRLLEGYGWEGRHHKPSIQLAGFYMDQFPEGDLARERANRHRLTLYPTVEEALTLGGSELAVDGVLIIGEHGNYPKNEMGQTLYPRYQWFKRIVKVFEESGRSVPVFNDKHLATTWPECMEMVNDARRMDFPFMAGSSLPVTWRIPAIDMPLRTPLEESLCVCYGGVDSYDFHGLETAQCMSERRAGGESGVKTMQAFRGEKLWSALQERKETWDLALAALARSHTVRGRPGYTYSIPDFEWAREASPNAVGYFMEHADGLQTTMLMLNGLVDDFTYAGRVRGSGRIISCQMHLPMPPRYTTLPNFFNPLMHHIERMIETGRTPYPVERTLITSGMTLFGVHSLHQGGTRLGTPEMAVAYEPSRPSTFWRT